MGGIEGPKARMARLNPALSSMSARDPKPAAGNWSGDQPTTTPTSVDRERTGRSQNDPLGPCSSAETRTLEVDRSVAATNPGERQICVSAKADTVAGGVADAATVNAPCPSRVAIAAC